MHKKDLHRICAELVYGTTLCLSGQFFDTDEQYADFIDTSTYATLLKIVMQRLRPTLVIPHNSKDKHT